MTGDMAAAALMWNASTTILDAQRTWREPNACAELEFDPRSETRAVAPGETVEVRVKYRTRDGQQPIPKGRWDAAAVQGGRVTEASGQVQPDGTFVMRYVARTSAAPKDGDGARIEALSAAGYTRDTWKILAGGKYEGRFTYVDSGNLGPMSDYLKVTGDLTWTPEDAANPSQPTFGDTKSSILRPSAGRFVVERGFLNKALGGPGDCKGSDQRTFPIESLASGALRYMTLEIAEDGRYKLTLVIPDRPNPFPTWQFEATCTFPNATTNERREVRDVAVVLGRQEGTLTTDGDVVGGLAAPIRRGPREITGSWSFKKPRQ